MKGLIDRFIAAYLSSPDGFKVFVLVLLFIALLALLIVG